MATTKNKTTQTNQPAKTHIDIISTVLWEYCGACYRLCFKKSLLLFRDRKLYPEKFTTNLSYLLVWILSYFDYEQSL